MRETLVIGVGNILLMDDGAGICAMRHLRDSKPRLADTQFLDAGTLNFLLSTDIERADNLVIFDAADLGEKPGTVQCFLNEELDDFLCSGSRSAHEIGIADLMDFARLLDCVPSNRALIGLQPEIIDWGEWLSEPVEAAIPRAAGMARQLIEDWSTPSRRRAGRWVGSDRAHA
jgi:hydrogenase maturation protease